MQKTRFRIMTQRRHEKADFTSFDGRDAFPDSTNALLEGSARQRWGEVVQAVRIARALSQGDLAQRLSGLVGRRIDTVYISKVENKKVKISYERLEEFASALEIETVRLVDFAQRLHEGGKVYAKQLKSAAELRARAMRVKQQKAVK